LEAHYLALGLVNIITVLSPQRIIMGGGVMDQEHLFPLIRAEVQTLLNGYIQKPEMQEGIDQFIVPPGLGNRAGVLGRGRGVVYAGAWTCGGTGRKDSLLEHESTMPKTGSGAARTRLFDPTEHPHRRRNVLNGDWVLVSPHRTKRPWQGQVKSARRPTTAPTYDPNLLSLPGQRARRRQAEPALHQHLCLRQRLCRAPGRRAAR
jgi:hypothetical protein